MNEREASLLVDLSIEHGWCEALRHVLRCKLNQEQVKDLLSFSERAVARYRAELVSYREGKRRA